MDDFMKEWLLSRLSIEYSVTPDIWQEGSFEDIPENANGAFVSFVYPYVAANGEFLRQGTSYDLYVGDTYKLNEILNELENDELQLNPEFRKI